MAKEIKEILTEKNDDGSGRITVITADDDTGRQSVRVNAFNCNDYEESVLERTIQEALDK